MVVMTEISSKDKIGSKSVWLPDFGNDDMKISGLRKTCLSFCYDEAIEKELTIDNNGVKSTSLGINGLKGIGLNLYYKRRLQHCWDISKGFLLVFV